MTGTKPKPGPKPDHLQIEETTWEAAMGKAVRKKKPAEGWPDGGKLKMKHQWSVLSPGDSGGGRPEKRICLACDKEYNSQRDSYDPDADPCPGEPR